MTEIALGGCRPVPLAGYLKALGVFRLVAEQADRAARAVWRDDVLVLESALDRDGLVAFFLDAYVPSPVVAPWNGGSGFHPKDNKEGFDPVAASPHPRFAGLAAAIAVGRRLLDEQGLEQRPDGAAKQRLLARLRAALPDDALSWLDAAVVIGAERPGYPPLLGTGGNDGRLDFTNNFLRRLVGLVDTLSGAARPEARPGLEGALFGAPTPRLGTGAIGQFAPGAAGGPNATTGFGRDALASDWDFVLMLEGALMFAASATRRLGAAGGESFAFPFTVRPTGGGGTGLALSDEGDARGEIWMPLWDRPAALPEIRALLSEGRATVGRRPARDGLDFARAAAGLGVVRGIAGFQRYGFLMRSGRAYVAAPLSRVPVRNVPAMALVEQFDQGEWLSRVRRAARAAEAPGRLRRVARQLDDAIFDLAQGAAGSGGVQAVVVAVGAIAAYLASAPAARESLSPPPRLGPRWLTEADDGTPAYRLARALAGLGRPPARPADGVPTPAGVVGPAPPLLAHLAPIDPATWYGRRRRWIDGEHLSVWAPRRLVDNLADVLDLRIRHAGSEGAADPFAGRRTARIDDVIAFLADPSLDGRIGPLACGLAWVAMAEPPTPTIDELRHRKVRPSLGDADSVPLAYALLKPFFTPVEALRTADALRATAPGAEGRRLSVPPGLAGRLRAGRVAEAVELACRRATASGWPVPFRSGAAAVAGPRLLASLLFPLAVPEVAGLIDRAFPDPRPEHEDAQEETDHAA